MSLKTIESVSGFNKHPFVKAEKYSHLSDAEIVDKILSGSTPLFEVIMRRYNQRLFRIQRSYISDEEAIKDTLQLTYLRVFENLSSFRGEAQLSTWITRIAINEALKYLNRQKRYSNLHLVDENRPMNEHTISSDNTPEDQAIQNDFKILLEKIVDKLPSKYRSVFIMREIEQMDTREAAECLDLTQSNVKVRLHRAKQMVRDELEKSVAGAEIFSFMGERCDRLVFNVMHVIEQQKQSRQ